MRPLDWVVLCGTLALIILYGLYRGRGSGTVSSYLLANKTMPWWAMGLSIMATQASAITFIGTTGQSYTDGMRFVQFYFGLPLAMVIVAATSVPFFHRAGVYTAYEYLEKRFDSKTRTLTSIVFLIQRGLGVGVALAAPAVVLSVLMGLPDRRTVVIMGTLIIAYTVIGGIRTVTWTDVLLMSIIFLGIATALTASILMMPKDVSLRDALYLAGASGKLNVVDLSFDWKTRYNLWSGLIGGTFLALSYFGCDQSQVQRYLTGKSIRHSRISLIFNAVMKVPMQFFILLTGALVFVFFLFDPPPMLFHRAERERVEKLDEYGAAEARYRQAFEERRQAAAALLSARDAAARERYRVAEKRLEADRAEGINLVRRTNGGRPYNDTNYIFLSFVTRYLPAGVVGLIMAAVFAAAMSSISGELNSLATSTVIDLYRRHLQKNASDRHYVLAARLATAFWGLYAMTFALFVNRLGSLIEAVNMVGSLFYGSVLGVFVLAFGVKRANGHGAVVGLLAGLATVWWISRNTEISFLWYNVAACLVVVAVGTLVSGMMQPAEVSVPQKASAN
ncbi:MAG: sodium:solute symporter [Acidobacteria bacterium]|nr:sodium:solute symporter [Acidobacteriota bacterium]